LLHSTVITSTDKNAGYHKQITHLLMQSAILVKSKLVSYTVQKT